MYVYHDNDNRVTILSQIDLTRVCVGGGGGGGGQREDKKGYGAIRFLKTVLYLWKRRCPCLMVEVCGSVCEPTGILAYKGNSYQLNCR